MDEFSPEQQLMVEIMRLQGVRDPEAVVRSDRVFAYHLGSHLLPVLVQFADAVTPILAAALAATDRPNPNAGTPPAAPS